MRRFLNGLVLGLVVGAAAYWYFEARNRDHTVTTPAPETQSTNANTNSALSDTLKAKLDALDLRASEIKTELAATGKVVRRKAREFGAEVADAATDARIVADIKSTYTVDPDLSVWQISVSSSGGHVTLSGTVAAPDDIGRAVALALQVKGVRDVSSTLRTKSD